MTLPRRKFVQLAAGAAALPVVLGGAFAADYPTRPVKIIAGFPAGGAVDVVARLIADWLSRCLNGQFVVENRPGAANNIGTGHDPFAGRRLYAPPYQSDQRHQRDLLRAPQLQLPAGQ